MPIKPSPTIAGKLRKLFNNNKQTIEPAIGDSIPGGSSPLIVTMTQDAPAGLEWTSETTAGEVYDAVTQGKTVYIQFDGYPINPGEEQYFANVLSGSTALVVGAIAWNNSTPGEIDDNATVRIFFVDLMSESNFGYSGSIKFGVLERAYNQNLNISFYD